MNISFGSENITFSPSDSLRCVVYPPPAGEPPEQRWSHIGPSGYTTQYMTRVNREGRLERLMSWMEEKTTRSLPMQLVRMFARARVQVTSPSCFRPATRQHSCTPYAPRHAPCSTTIVVIYMTPSISSLSIVVATCVTLNPNHQIEVTIVVLLERNV